MNRLTRIHRIACTLLAVATAAPLAAQAPVATEFDKLHFRSIGPATMSGRVADVAVYEANPAIYYVGTAHGGVWKTTSNGTQMTPLLQDKGLLSIGDIAVSQLNPDVVYVGTGESNNRQSTSWGEGVWKSTDAGRTWRHVGLADVASIGALQVHPTDPNVAFVAAIGDPFRPTNARGLYRTRDGGASWQRVLFVSDSTGAVDVEFHPTNPQIVYAAMWRGERKPWTIKIGRAHV